MKLRLLWHIMRRQFITQRLVIIPFILAVSVLFMIEYTLVSIGLNSYIKQKNDFLVPFIIIANFFMALLTFIFIFYANHFMMSQRRKEFSIFMTLGMTKKSMRLIVVMETILQFIIISVVSIAGGYLLGAIFFLFIQKIMGIEVATLRYYPFDSVAMFITLIIIAVLMGMLLIFNLFSINFQRPITYQHRSDSSVISRWLRYVLIVIGSAALYLGYFIALQQDTTFGAFFKIWIVIGLVIIGTYAFFVGISEIIISILQQASKVYYHPRYFFVVVGMRVRLKMNAVSLATITLLCTFLIVTLTMTLTTYRDMNHTIMKLITNVPIFKKQSKVGLNNEVFKVKQLDAHALNLMMIQDSMVLIVKDNNQLQKVKGFYAHEQKKSTISINFNVSGKTKLTTSQIQKLSKKYDASINSKSEMLMVWDRLTGGLIFVGGVVSIVLVIGIFLMMYYKQVSEAYANQHNYDIMKKLGLDNGRIAKITRNQMTFLFAIPITVALIHTLISSNIVYTLLNMIGINNHHIFLTSYVLTVIIISFLYMAMYKITSYIYAKVIHQQRN